MPRERIEQLEVRVSALSPEYVPRWVGAYQRGAGQHLLHRSRHVVWAHYDYVTDDGRYVSGRFRVIDKSGSLDRDTSEHPPDPPSDQEFKELIVQALKRCGLPEDTVFPTRLTVEKCAALSGNHFLRPLRRV